MLAISDALKRSVRFGIRALPPRLRVFADTAVGGLSDTYANWRLSAYQVRGRLLVDDLEGVLIYFGELPQYKTWLANLFVAGVEAEPIGRFPLLDIATRKGRLAACDVLVCPINPLSRMVFAARGWFVVPKYVKCLLDLHKPLEQLVRRHAVKDDLRIARKKNFHFAVLREDAAFEEFYHQMLVPTSQTRHEDRANISTLDSLRAVFRLGYLLAAYQGDDWVGANLMVPEDSKTLYWANVGWRDGSAQLMKDRLVSALVYEMIARAKNDGYDTLDLGSCNPFVNDGPLNYKLKWGAHMALPQPEYENDRLQGLNTYLAAHYNLESAAAQAMLKHAPILDKLDARLRAVGWNAVLRSDFKHQVDAGLPWIDLANPDNLHDVTKKSP